MISSRCLRIRSVFVLSFTEVLKYCVLTIFVMNSEKLQCTQCKVQSLLGVILVATLSGIFNISHFMARVLDTVRFS